MNFAEVLRRRAAAHPDRVALSADGGESTYAELCDMAARIAGLLVERGVERGEVVAIRLRNGIDLPACYFGAMMAGAAVTTVNPLLRTPEAERVLRDSGARILLGDAPEDMSPELAITPIAPDAATR